MTKQATKTTGNFLILFGLILVLSGPLFNVQNIYNIGMMSGAGIACSLIGGYLVLLSNFNS